MTRGYEMSVSLACLPNMRRPSGPAIATTCSVHGHSASLSMLTISQNASMKSAKRRLSRRTPPLPNPRLPGPALALVLKTLSITEAASEAEDQDEDEHQNEDEHQDEDEDEEE